MVNFGHPANRGLIAYLSADTRQKPGTRPQAPPADITDPYCDLGTESEIVHRLWDDLGGVLPANCRWVLYGTPVLVHYASGVVFGFAGGSSTYALRLPPAERALAIAAGAETVHHYPAYAGLNIAASRLDLTRFGPGWVFGSWLKGEEDWCRAAFEAAGTA
jgi:hypothetical protein